MANKVGNPSVPVIATIPSMFSGSVFSFVQATAPMRIESSSLRMSGFYVHDTVQIQAGTPPSVNIDAADSVLIVYGDMSKAVEYAISKTTTFTTFYTNPASAALNYVCAEIGVRTFYIKVRYTDSSEDATIVCTVEVADENSRCV